MTVVWVVTDPTGNPVAVAAAPGLAKSKLVSDVLRDGHQPLCVADIDKDITLFDREFRPSGYQVLMYRAR